VLVEYVDPVLEEGASCLLDHAVKGVEKEAELVLGTTLLLVEGRLACRCHAWREFDESGGLAKAVSSQVAGPLRRLEPGRDPAKVLLSWEVRSSRV